MKKINGDIKSFLSQIGLTSTEITLYVTGLQFGSQTTAEIAKRAGIKRTTAHSALCSLEQKGLVGLHIQTGVNKYTMKDPNLIERSFVEKIDELKNKQLDFINLLPLFDKISTQNSIATEVFAYNGFDGVKTVIDTALYCASRKWKIISPTRNFFSESGKEYSDYFIKIRKQRGIRARSLWESSFLKKRTISQTAFEFREPRIIPKALEGKFSNTIIIFDNSVAFINSYDESSAVLIKSIEISNTMEVFFDGLWASSKLIPRRNISK
ncbi:hypothetical protein H6784_03260 [Candidatus Nomurabacteria bacterium]|nr:hypothetical protein [Candidatus Kaiserbacteria bacterium]MCB9811152.1 hypothetical protein [Candidatus Nomurabacteria bacterium]MCB9814411.1 hypothetical protein [Candidatus Nomurabacteria bacterium]